MNSNCIMCMSSCCFDILQYSFLWYCTGVVLSGMQINSQFTKQPGDIALIGIPGYPLTVVIPCVLDVDYELQDVSWEHQIETEKPKAISLNRTIYPRFQGTYEFDRHEDKLDFSILMKLVPWYKPQVRCYASHYNLDISYSSWSNITYVGMCDSHNLSLTFDQHNSLCQIGKIGRLAIFFHKVVRR